MNGSASATQAASAPRPCRQRTACSDRTSALVFEFTSTSYKEHVMVTALSDLPATAPQAAPTEPNARTRPGGSRGVVQSPVPKLSATQETRARSARARE